MTTQPKLIILNGFAGIGKTTIARRYIDEHPLDLSLEGDTIIVMLGQWLTYEEKAREYVIALLKSMAATHLRHGRSVLLPYLLTNARHAEEFERIARQQNARFFEIYLFLEKEEALCRLLERGTWGEPGLPTITEKDLPEMSKLYDTMTAATVKRPKTIMLHPLKDDIDQTYKAFLEAIEETDT